MAECNSNAIHLEQEVEKKDGSDIQKTNEETVHKQKHDKSGKVRWIKRKITNSSLPHQNRANSSPRGSKSGSPIRKNFKKLLSHSPFSNRRRHVNHEAPLERNSSFQETQNSPKNHEFARSISSNPRLTHDTQNKSFNDDNSNATIHAAFESSVDNDKTGQWTEQEVAIIKEDYERERKERMTLHRALIQIQTQFTLINSQLDETSARCDSLKAENLNLKGLVQSMTEEGEKQLQAQEKTKFLTQVSELKEELATTKQQLVSLTKNRDSLLGAYQEEQSTVYELKKVVSTLQKETAELKVVNIKLPLTTQASNISTAPAVTQEEMQKLFKPSNDREQEEQESLKKELAEKDKKINELEIESFAKQNTISKLQKSLEDFEKSWKISHMEVTFSKNELGRGGWGVVWKGHFRGQHVAVKQIYELIMNKHYLQLLHREINIMAGLRHPNLLQFIGAVFDHPSGNPMIITEVMDTSLRKAYEEKELTPDQQPVILFIMRDVAVGLNYLHCLHDPIIHRDVSSANVLLESKGPGKWKTKISDFGSAKLARSATTIAPGAETYSAPESLPNILNTKIIQQSPKMDVYSYGVLLCEAINCRYPDRSEFRSMLQQIHDNFQNGKELYSLISVCREQEPDKRPHMSDIINILNKLY